MRAQLAALRPILVALGMAVVIGAVLMAVSGSDPVGGYRAIISGSLGSAGWSQTVSLAILIVGSALAVALPLRAGLVNLGGEGQLVGGGMAAVLVATWLPGLPAPVALIAALAAAAAVGAIIGLVPAVMENTIGVPLLISSLLLSYPIVALTSYLVRFPLLDKGTGLPQTETLPAAFHLPELGKISGALPVMVVIVALVIVVDRLMPAGYEIRLTGLNRSFTAYSGVDVRAITLRVMAGGGAIAGVVGALIVTSFPYRYVDGSLITPGYVWTGLLAAMLARANPIGAVVAGAFFAALEVGGEAMERDTFVPRELSSILQATVIIILAGAIALNLRKSQKVA
jgi:general nucleoside transport system permease protein